MSYVVLKAMKIKRTDGSGITDWRLPGDLAPEVATWPNPNAWIESKHIKALDPAATHTFDRSKLKPAQPASDSPSSASPVPKAGEELPGYRGTSDAKPAEPAEEQVTHEMLMGMSRTHLNQLADSEGIDSPETLPNKRAVSDAILALQEG